MLVSFVSSSDFWKVRVICLFQFSLECIVQVAGVSSVRIECGLLCSSKCLLEVFYAGCAEIPSCVGGWWLVLFFVIRKDECEKVIADIAK